MRKLSLLIVASATLVLIGCSSAADDLAECKAEREKGQITESVDQPSGFLQRCMDDKGWKKVGDDANSPASWKPKNFIKGLFT